MNLSIDFSSSWLIVLLAMWELIWKGLALYQSAREDDRVWFVAILFINSLGLLPIFYLIIKRFRKRSLRMQMI